MPPKSKAADKSQADVALSDGPDAVFAWVKFGVVDDQALQPQMINLDVDIDILIEHLKASLSSEVFAYCQFKRILIEQARAAEAAEAAVVDEGNETATETKTKET